MIHEFQYFTLEYNPETGAVTTTYPDGTHCPVQVNQDHAYHANLTGISPANYNLLHELCHHIIAFTHGHKTCPIVWASAHGLPMPDNAQLLEWQITAFSYFALEAEMRDSSEWGAIMDIAKLANVYALKETLLSLFNKLKD